MKANFPLPSAKLLNIHNNNYTLSRAGRMCLFGLYELRHDIRVVMII